MPGRTPKWLASNRAACLLFCLLFCLHFVSMVSCPASPPPPFHHFAAAGPRRPANLGGSACAGSSAHQAGQACSGAAPSRQLPAAAAGGGHPCCGICSSSGGSCAQCRRCGSGAAARSAGLGCCQGALRPDKLNPASQSCPAWLLPVRFQPAVASHPTVLPAHLKCPKPSLSSLSVQTFYGYGQHLFSGWVDSIDPGAELFHIRWAEPLRQLSCQLSCLLSAAASGLGLLPLLVPNPAVLCALPAALMRMAAGLTLLLPALPLLLPTPACACACCLQL